MLVHAAAPAADYARVTLAQLSRVCRNATRDVDDSSASGDRYRRLLLSNAQVRARIVANAAAAPLLASVGWQRDDTAIHLPAAAVDVPLLLAAADLLQQASVE